MRDKGLIFEEARRARRTLGVREGLAWPELIGLLLVLPFHGVETGLTNWNTFTDVSFSFRLSPRIAVDAFVIAFVLGLVGGALPALRAARLQPVDALRIR